MSSFDQGKEFMSGWIRGRFDDGATCLDVGACDGNWWNRVGGFLTMDAVEIWQPNVERHQLEQKYRRVWCMDVAELEYEYYDLIIFGDVIEHMDVEKAQRVLEYARPRCRDMIVAVPYLYRQGPNYGNRWEIHVQEDLTPELFDRRYPGMRIIHRPVPNYAYYAKNDALTQEEVWDFVRRCLLCFVLRYLPQKQDICLIQTRCLSDFAW